MLSMHSANVLRAWGFTPNEILELSESFYEQKDGVKIPQTDPNLDDPVWRDALRVHRDVRNDFYSGYRDENPFASYYSMRAAYIEYIEDWRNRNKRARDPWIWTDQFYFKGGTRKDRREQAIRLIGELEDSAPMYFD
jgi:hypothetical protein